jgi:hypothetical protein
MGLIPAPRSTQGRPRCSGAYASARRSARCGWPLGQATSVDAQLSSVLAWPESRYSFRGLVQADARELVGSKCGLGHVQDFGRSTGSADRGKPCRVAGNYAEATSTAPRERCSGSERSFLGTPRQRVSATQGFILIRVLRGGFAALSREGNRGRATRSRREDRRSCEEHARLLPPRGNQPSRE